MNDNLKDYKGSDYLKLNGVVQNKMQTISAFPKKFTKSQNNENDVGKSHSFIKQVKDRLVSFSSAMQTSKNNDNIAEIDTNKNNVDLNFGTMQTSVDTITLNPIQSFDLNKQSLSDSLNEEQIIVETHSKTQTKNSSKPDVLLSKDVQLTGSEKKSFLSDLKLSKIFNTKNNKIAVGVVILAIVLVMFLNFSSSTTGSKNTNATTTFNALEYVSSKAYVSNMENKLVGVLSSIKGAGNVSVMITLESGPELKIATSVDERTNTTTSNSTSTTNVTVIENPIIITKNGQSNPLVLMEIMPVIKGVVVVAEGANNTKVKLQLLEAVQSLLNITSNSIQVYPGI